jgi:hypothetical protein
LTEPSAEQPESLQVPLIWVGVDDTKILFANQFLGQVHQQDVILTLGQLSPPVLVGTPEERLEEATRLGYVPVKAVARFGLTRQRLAELIGVLQQTAANYDAQSGGVE